MSCPRCQNFATQNLQLRKEIYRLNDLLLEERKRNEEMDVLCLEIEKTKEKLYQKLLSRRQVLDSVIVT
jgi:hypothetical protein